MIEDSRDQADGWFLVDEATTLCELQESLDGIGMLAARLKAVKLIPRPEQPITLHTLGMYRQDPDDTGIRLRWNPIRPEYGRELCIGFRDHVDGPPIPGIGMTVVDCLHIGECPDAYSEWGYPVILEERTGWGLPVYRPSVVSWRMAGHGRFIELATRRPSMFMGDLDRYPLLFDAHAPVDAEWLDRQVTVAENRLRRLMEGQA